MKKIIYLTSFAAAVFFTGCCDDATKEMPIVKNEVRAPAYPLITIDPNTSAWSATDVLYDSNVQHWTGKDFPLVGAIRVDGETYRFMGAEIPELETVAGMSIAAPWEGKYTFDEPKKDWETTNFNDGAWKTSAAAFGTKDETNVKTLWETKDIWVRRDINLSEDLANKTVVLEFSHDDIFELYINGIQVIKTGYVWRKNVREVLSEEVVKTLKAGKNVIAAHCHNRTGGALVDFGLYTEKENGKPFAKTATQKSVDVQAMQTHYTFEAGNVELKLTFMAPLFLDDLDLMSRPINYISYVVKSLDDKEHDVQMYFDAAPHWAVNTPMQPNKADATVKDGLVYVKTGSVEQNVLGKRGDDLRIDWGHFYMSAEEAEASYNTGNAYAMRQTFADGGKLNNTVDYSENANIAIAQSLGTAKIAAGKVMLGYDDIYSIQYFGDNIRGYWNRTGDKTIEMMFAQANKDFPKLRKKAYEFDLNLMEEATKVGGKNYAELCALAYRQAISAHKLIETPSGELAFLSKENNSNGSIGTVDVTYPSAPMFLYYNPELAKALLNFIFYYSESGKWTKPFPAHDVGTYPLANGQTYGGDMPVEEAGNMLALTAAVAVMEGNAKYAEKHWDVLTTWTDYLVEKGLDPENQLCTDDFAGHFAHNVNLSVKAIMGIASYGYLADQLGKKDVAEKYTTKAKEMAQEWMKMANDGDHYRLTFDKEGTWSQKYNIIWDKMFKWGIFPKEVIDTELKYYLTKQNTYGLPLDNRRTYTKTDWIVWTATLTDDQATFEQFIAPIHKFMNETTDRIPMSDWTYTDRPVHSGFKARSVVGGYYIKLLDNKLNK